KEAYEIANEGTWSKKEFEVYEYWQMRLQDERGALENSFDEGKIEGRIEGRLEGIVEGQRTGLIEGIEGMLEIKYADEAAALMDRVRTLESIEQLQAFKALLRKSASVDDLWIYLRGA
ncbi:MAG: hypothetical protein SFH39_07960, partial [Candidatus Magnetobacterium sp. LHC-1]